MDADPGAATDWALDAADAAVRCQLQHKALLLLLALGVPRAQAGGHGQAVIWARSMCTGQPERKPYVPL